MRATTAVLATAFALASATCAIAVVDPAPDRIGIYFDTSADEMIGYSSSLAPLTAYVILTTPTFSPLYGWQAEVRETGSGQLLTLSTSVTGGGANSASERAFSVIYDVPLPTQPATVLGTLNFLIISPAAICLVLTGIDNPAIPEALPLVWKEPELPSAIQTSRAYPNGVTASINDYPTFPEYPQGCIDEVGVQLMNWGALKSNYR